VCLCVYKDKVSLTTTTTKTKTTHTKTTQEVKEAHGNIVLFIDEIHLVRLSSSTTPAAGRQVNFFRSINRMTSAPLLLSCLTTIYHHHHHHHPTSH